MNEEVLKLIEKSDHALEVTEQLIASGYPSDSISKTYYAMFYITQALLKSNGIEVIKHSAVESALGYHFAKTGKIDPKFHRMFIDARKYREMADYDIQEEIPKQVASCKLEDCRAYISAVKKLINKE